MNIHYCPDFDQMSQKGADLVHFAIAKKPNLLFCAASGGSPAGLYQLMGKKHQSNPEFFDRIQVVKLDEWVGLPENSEFTSEFDIQQKLLQQIDFPAERYISFNAQSKDPKKECQRIQETLEKNGPIDICILGIGQNGHIALNEPNQILSVDCHVSKLSETTLASGMIQNVGVPLKEGMTLGIGNILRSKMVILFIAGKGKEEALKSLLKKEINPQLPASMLWLHPNAHVIVDESSIE